MIVLEFFILRFSDCFHSENGIPLPALLSAYQSPLFPPKRDIRLVRWNVREVPRKRHQPTFAVATLFARL
jgi:hypothetical protein